MRGRVITIMILLSLGAASAAPGLAAGPKPKAKPFKGSYGVTLVPDPTNIASQLPTGMAICAGVNPLSIDKHTVSLPGAGALKVKLTPTNPVANPQEGYMWDLAVFTAGQTTSPASSPGATDRSLTFTSATKQTITIASCNMFDGPNATVDYTFIPS